MSNNGQPDLKVFSTGAVRSKDADSTAFSLISPIAAQAEAEVLAKGDIKYGAYNWEKGMPVRDCLEHAMRHINLYLGGDRSEPHLAHARTNLGFALHSEALWPHLNLDLRREGCIPPTVDDETAASWRKFKDAMTGLQKESREAEGKADEAPVVGEAIREGDVVSIDAKGSVRKWVSRPVEAPAPKVPTRFYLLADSSDRLQMARYRSDLQWEGHEVVSRWIDFPGITIGEDDFDIQSCDVVVIFSKRSRGMEDCIGYAHHFNKRAVFIGECPAGYPEHGTGDRWFSSWEAFLKGLSSSRTAGPVVASR